MSLCLSLSAMIWPTCTSLVLASVLASSILAIHSSKTMLDQVPMQTVICQYFPIRTVAPHREAFQRTSTIVLYVNARILGVLVLSSLVSTTTTPISTNFSNALLQNLSWILTTMACARMFWPLSSLLKLDMTNGNTFCFVLPMMASVFGDYLMTLGLNSYLSSTSSEESPHPHWLSLRQLIFVQCSGLVIAFLFTLAFRKHINIRHLYWVTTAAVYGMVLWGGFHARHVLSEIVG